MPDTRAPTVPQFTRRLGIETPEHVVLELELAGLGSRLAAAVCDAGVLAGAYLLLGIRVVMDTGHPLSFSAAAVRNLVRIVDMQPVFTYQVGLAFVLFHSQNKRLGDIVAGTVVVRDRPENLQLASAAADRAREPEALEAGSPELADEEFRLLDQLLERLEGLEGAAWRRISRGPAPTASTRACSSTWSAW